MNGPTITAPEASLAVEPGADPQLALLERIARSLDELNRRLAEPPTPRLLYRLEDLEAATGMNRRTIQRERSAGRFPPPTVKLAKTSFWSPESLRSWVDAGGKVLSASTQAPANRPTARRA